MKSTKLFKGDWEFTAGAASISQIPNGYLPEFAFVGRSNVGKSTLINAITYCNGLARVSQRPGCTKQLNFFMLETKLMLVDLPGYGFAKISHKERSQWDTLIHSYLRGRSQLKRVFLLIDSRHPLKDLDTKTMSFLDEYAVAYQVVLTKADKSEILADLTSDVEKLSQRHSACHPHVLVTSSKSSEGVENVRREILKCVYAS